MQRKDETPQRAADALLQAREEVFAKMLENHRKFGEVYLKMRDLESERYALEQEHYELDQEYTRLGWEWAVAMAGGTDSGKES